MSTTAPPINQKTPKVHGERRGLVVVNTGDGKGKTAAALGFVTHAHGRGLRTRLFQLTGRNAPEELVNAADAVTEMRHVKHAFDANVPTQRGIER